MSKYLGWLKFVPIWLGLMSGSFSIIREVALLYSETPSPIWQKTLFWSCVKITFFPSMIVAWVIKHNELLTERAKNAKPNIGGKIKEVHVSKHFSLLSKAISDEFYDGFYFAIRVYAANQGAATTISEFKFVLTSNGCSYIGEKASLEGYYIERRDDPTFLLGVESHIAREDLTDIEDSNDEPLDHTRNGWLRFRVSTIPQAENDVERQMEIELTAIDKYRTEYKLDSLPQSQWEKSKTGEIKRRE